MGRFFAGEEAPEAAAEELLQFGSFVASLSTSQQTRSPAMAFPL